MTLAQRAPVARQLGGGERPPLVRELVGAVTEQLGGGRIECDRNLFAGFVAGCLVLVMIAVAALLALFFVGFGLRRMPGD